VYLCRRKCDGAVYAIKKIPLKGMNLKDRQNALNEVRILASVQHENVVAYKEAFFEEETQMLCIVLEYADGGDLMKRVVD
jgi:NIMA (never in mitosis gene a)-related kinase 1/4/5